ALDRAMKSDLPPTAPPPKPAPLPATLNYVGKEQRDLEGYKIVTGKARFTADIYFPDMLYVRVKRSPYPHANVKSIDTTKAAALPGVFSVMTSKDIPDKVTAGIKPILAKEAALVGDPIVAVAAGSDTGADNAL